MTPPAKLLTALTSFGAAVPLLVVLTASARHATPLPAPLAAPTHVDPGTVCWELPPWVYQILGSFGEPFKVSTRVTVYSLDGTAIAGEDYVAVRTTLPVPAGATSIGVPVQIMSDDLREGDETFTLIFVDPADPTRTVARVPVIIRDGARPA